MKETELERLRRAVLARHQELMAQEEERTEVEATLDALNEVTAVPRAEIEALARQILGPQGPEPQVDEVAQFLAQEAYFPPEVRRALLEFEPPWQEEFLAQYTLASKNRGAAFLFALMPPPLSAHYLYLGRWWIQIPYSLSLGGCLLWWMVDLFRTGSLTYQANRDMARKLYRKLLKSPPGRS